MKVARAAVAMRAEDAARISSPTWPGGVDPIVRCVHGHVEKAAALIQDLAARSVERSTLDPPRAGLLAPVDAVVDQVEVEADRVEQVGGREILDPGAVEVGAPDGVAPVRVFGPVDLAARRIERDIEGLSAGAADDRLDRRAVEVGTPDRRQPTLRPVDLAGGIIDREPPRQSEPGEKDDALRAIGAHALDRVEGVVAVAEVDVLHGVETRLDDVRTAIHRRAPVSQGVDRADMEVVGPRRENFGRRRRRPGRLRPHARTGGEGLAVEGPPIAVEAGDRVGRRRPGDLDLALGRRRRVRRALEVRHQPRPLRVDDVRPGGRRRPPVSDVVDRAEMEVPGAVAERQVEKLDRALLEDFRRRAGRRRRIGERDQL